MSGPGSSLSVRDQLGGLDVAHLNAGVTTGVADITELTDEQYRRIVGVNMDGVVFGVREVVPRAPQQRRRGDRGDRFAGGDRRIPARCRLHAHQACGRRPRQSRSGAFSAQKASRSMRSARVSSTRRFSQDRSATRWLSRASR